MNASDQSLPIYGSTMVIGVVLAVLSVVTFISKR